MSLLSRVKENLTKEEEKPQKKVLVKENKTLNLFDFEFKRYDYMDNIKEGNYQLIPTCCALSHYLLVNKGVGYYCGLEDNETGNQFEIYEIVGPGDYWDEKNASHRQRPSSLSLSQSSFPEYHQLVGESHPKFLRENTDQLHLYM